MINVKEHNPILKKKTFFAEENSFARILSQHSESMNCTPNHSLELDEGIHTNLQQIDLTPIAPRLPSSTIVRDNNPTFPTNIEPDLVSYSLMPGARPNPSVE